MFEAKPATPTATSRGHVGTPASAAGRNPDTACRAIVSAAATIPLSPAQPGRVDRELRHGYAVPRGEDIAAGRGAEAEDNGQQDRQGHVEGVRATTIGPERS